MEAAAAAENDSQIIEKVKNLLSKYSNSERQSSTEGNGSDYDFTTDWVKNNGIVDSNVVNVEPPKAQSKKGSSLSTTSEGARLQDIPSVISPRRGDRGISKIPAPVRSNTGLY